MKDNEYYKSIYDIKSWLNIHIAQLTFTRNIILTFAAASLGYGINEYRKVKVNLLLDEKVTWGIAFLFLLFSILAGVILAFNESENYRHKRVISRIILEEGDKFSDTNPMFRENVKKCDRIEANHFGFFSAQILLFSGGFILLAALLFFAA